MKKILMIGLMLSVLILAGCNSTAEKELTNECNRLGYQNLTDYQIYIRDGDGRAYIRIECDNNIIPDNCYNRRQITCDKFNECDVTHDIWECNYKSW